LVRWLAAFTSSGRRPRTRPETRHASQADLQRLRLAIDLYAGRNGRLPASLDELHTEAGTNIYARDPQSEQPYVYCERR
jgi:hypothetical protein